MTLNGVIALISRYFTEFHSIANQLYVTVVEDRPMMTAKYRLYLAKTQQSHGFIATAKILVQLSTIQNTIFSLRDDDINDIGAVTVNNVIRLCWKCA